MLISLKTYTCTRKYYAQYTTTYCSKADHSFTHIHA